jgi:hypothetical protein
VLREAKQPLDRDLIRRLEVLREFADANRTEERLEEAHDRQRTHRAFQQRIGFHCREVSEREVVDRRQARVQARLRARLSHPPLLGAAEQSAAAAWLGKVHSAQDPRYWLSICLWKIATASEDKARFWHACRLIVLAQGQPPPHSAQATSAARRT